MSQGGLQVSSPVLEREFSGILQQDRIVGSVYNYLRNELVFVCCNDALQLFFYRLNVNKGTETRKLQLSKYEPAAEPKGVKKPRLSDKKVDLKVAPSEVSQLHLVAFEGVPVLIILRKNQSIEVVYNFSETIFVDTRLNFARILPCFG
jgi:hypothetical protein